MSPASHSGRSRFCQLLAVSAILMLAVFALVQAAHIHTDGQFDSVHCSICLAAHQSTAVISTPPFIPELMVVQAPLPEPVCQFIASPQHSELFSRPPPSV
jgi:hypothetical protein